MVPLEISSQLLELMPVAVYVCDEEGRIVRHNTRARELWGRDPGANDRFCPSTKVALQDGTFAPNSHTHMAAALRDGTSFRDLDVYAHRGNGTIAHGVVNIDAIRDDSGKIIGAINVIRDVTTLHETQEIFATIFEQAAIGIVLVNVDGSVREVNPFICQILGYGRAEMVGQHFTKFWYPDDHETALAAFSSLLQDGRLRHYSAERRFQGKDGRVVIGRITAAKTIDSFDRITIVATIEDITQEKAAEKALARSQAYLKRLLESQVVGIGLWDEETGQIDDANDELLRMLGYSREDLEQKRINSNNFTAPEHLGLKKQAVAKLKATGWCAPFEKLSIRKDGSRIPVLIGFAATDEPGKSVCWVLDVSRQKELEKQLLQTQKMEAVGQLAGGIAHDFNNLLMVIGAHVELLSMGSLSETAQAKYLGNIESATKQASHLTRKLLAFSRRQELTATEFEVGEFMQEAINFVAPSLSKRIEVIFRKASDCWICADHCQLEHVVVNLLLNARDAMPHGGRIMIDTANIAVSELEIGLHDTVPAGKYALIKVADTGEGIPPENIHRIFDPFFTTKPKDRGTGLGLAIAYSVVTQSGGHIRVKSSPNTGTTFCVYLPSINTPPIEEVRKERCSRQMCPLSGTILLVDDEEAIRGSVRALLEGYGMVVEEAASVSEALQIAETLADSLSVIVTDVVMPGMSGLEIAYALRKKHSHVPVVFMSGYAAGEQGHQLFRKATFLQKPFNRTKLVKALQRAVECPQGSKDCITGL